MFHLEQTLGLLYCLLYVTTVNSTFLNHNSEQIRIWICNLLKYSYIQQQCLKADRCKSESVLAHISNLPYKLTGLLTAFDNTKRYDLRLVCKRRNNKRLSIAAIPLCFLLLADFKQLVNGQQTYLKKHRVNISTNTKLIPAKGSLEITTENEITYTDLQNSTVRETLIPPGGPATHRPDTKSKTVTVHRRKIRSANEVPVRLTFDANYKEIVDGRREQFRDHLNKQLAKIIRVPLSSIKDFKMSEDRITCDFVIATTNDHNNIMDDVTIQDAAIDLQTRIHNGKFKIMDLDSNILPVVQSESVVDVATNLGTDITPIILGIVIGIFLLIFVLVILAAIIVQHINKTNKCSISPRNNRISYKTFQNEDTFVSITGRDSNNSIGKYSYDSGVWIGPGPEPRQKVPEAPLYRPPTVLQVRETPRPRTAVRVRLKDDWNIDTEKAFVSTIQE